MGVLRSRLCVRLHVLVKTPPPPPPPATFGCGVANRTCLSKSASDQPAKPPSAASTLCPHSATPPPTAEGQQLARHLHVTVSQGFGGPRSSPSRIHTCTCITNHFFLLTDTTASASAISLQPTPHSRRVKQPTPDHPTPCCSWCWGTKQQRYSIPCCLPSS
jgi:hypothetical protein